MSPVWAISIPCAFLILFLASIFFDDLEILLSQFPQVHGFPCVASQPFRCVTTTGQMACPMARFFFWVSLRMQTSTVQALPLGLPSTQLLTSAHWSFTTSDTCTGSHARHCSTGRLLCHCSVEYDVELAQGGSTTMRGLLRLLKTLQRPLRGDVRQTLTTYIISDA